MAISTKKFDPSAGVLLVSAKIDGGRVTEKAQLVFDTGATFCMLPERIVSSIGVEVTHERTIETMTAAGVMLSPVVTLPKIEVLGHVVEDVECIVRDLPPESGVDGLLGLSFLKHFKVEIDFQNGILELER